MNYLKYGIEDFVLDESFQSWVKGSDPSVNIFWDNFLYCNPDKKETIEKARELLLNFEFSEKSVNEEVVQNEWHQLSSYLNLGKGEAKVRTIGVFLAWQKVAAAVIFILTATVGSYLYHQSQYIIYKTQYAETKTVTLPDHSVVTLNSNSKLRFKKDWSEEVTRFVDLEGEAYFSVMHKKDHQKFIVKTDELKVIVLGTEFDVNTRRGKTKVVLSSGKVKLRNSKNEKYIMSPGELVVYSNDTYVKNEVKPELYTGWRNNKLEFRNTSIEEIADILEDNYGYKVIIKESSIRHRKLTGIYPADNVNILIKALTGIFNLNITQNEKELILETKK